MILFLLHFFITVFSLNLVLKTLLTPPLGLLSILQLVSEPVCNPRIMTSMNNAFSEGQSIARPPMFNGGDYAYWKARMKIYLVSVDYDVWELKLDINLLLKLLMEL